MFYSINIMHRYICDYRYGGKFCNKLCQACRWHLTKHIKKPVEPKKGDCCGDSCQSCVWNVYFEEKEAYPKKVEDTLNEAFEKAKRKEKTITTTTN